MSKAIDSDGTGNTLKAVENTSVIIETLEELERAGVSELANHLGLSKSTVHAYLKTLEQTGYVLNENGTYRLSLRFLEHGGRVRQREPIFRAAKAEVKNLAEETGEAANLGVEENGQRVLLYRTEVDSSVFDNSPTGEYTNMHWTALGKSLLAYMPESDVEEILDEHGLPEGTEHTITDRERLLEELEQVRARGYSVENQERSKGILSVAAPILNQDNENVVGAVSISGPKHRLQERVDSGEIPNAVQSAANVIELKYAHYDS